MNKKKIISSLTAAGILATVGATGVMAADTETTKALGEFTNLIEEKTVVPFILKSESDRVTGKDLKDSFANSSKFTFKSKALADDQVLATGDVVYIDGTPRTIVVYGDVNGNGEVTIADAVAIVRHLTGDEKISPADAKFIAADLDHNKEIKINDAVGIARVLTKDNAYSNITTAPTEAVEVSEIKDLTIRKYNVGAGTATLEVSFDKLPKGYTFEVVSEEANGTDLTVGNTSAEGNTVKIDVSGIVQKDEYTLKVFDADKKEIATKTVVFRTVNVPTLATAQIKNDAAIKDTNVGNYSMVLKIISGTDTNEVSADLNVKLYSKDDGEAKYSLKAEATGKLAANTSSASVTFGNLNKLEDGEYIVLVEAKDANGNIAYNTRDALIGQTDLDTITNAIEVATPTLANFYTVNKASEVPEVFADVKRNGTGLDVTANSNKLALKYYVIVKDATDSTVPSVDDLKKSSNVAVATGTTAQKTITVANVRNLGNAKKVYVLAENPVSGITSHVLTVNLPSDDITELSKVTGIKIDTTVDSENLTVYSWVDSNKKGRTGYQVKVYRTHSGDTTVVAEERTSSTEYDIKNVMKQYGEAGDTFTIAVKVLGDGTTYADSDYETTAPNVGVVAVNAVTNISFDQKTAVLSWAKAADTKDTEKLVINLYKAFKNDDATNGYEYKLVKSGIETGANTSYMDLSSYINAEKTGLYTATITSIAKADSYKVDTKEKVQLTTIGDMETVTDYTTVATAATFVYAEAPAITNIKAKATTITVRYVPLDIPGFTGTVSYKAVVMKKNADNGNYDVITGFTQTPATTPVAAADETDKNDHVISGTGIEASKDYKVKLQATVNGNVKETAFQDVTTTAVAIPATTYTVVDISDKTLAEATVTGTDIGITSDGYIKTATVAYNSDTPNYREFKEIIEKLDKNDTFTMNPDDEVTAVTITGGTESRVVNLGALNKKATLTINGTAKKVTVTGSVETVTATSGSVNLSGLTVAKKINSVAAASDLTVKEGTTAVLAAGTLTLNGVKMTVPATEVKVGADNEIKFMANVSGVDITDSSAVLATSDDYTLNNLTITTTDDDFVPVINLVNADVTGTTTLNGAGDVKIVTTQKYTFGTTTIKSNSSEGMTLTFKDGSDDGTITSYNELYSIEGNVTIESAKAGGATLYLDEKEATKIPAMLVNAGVAFKAEGNVSGTYEVNSDNKLTINMTSGKIVVGTRASDTRTITSNVVKVAIPAGVNISDVTAVTKIGDAETTVEKEDIEASSDNGYIEITVPAGAQKLIINWNGVKEIVTL